MRKLVGKRRFFQVQSVKSGGRLVRNARFELSMCLGLMLWLCGGVPVPIGKAANLVLFVRVEIVFCVAGKGLRDIVSTCQKMWLMSFCVAGVVLCDIPRV